VLPKSHDNDWYLVVLSLVVLKIDASYLQILVSIQMVLLDVHGERQEHLDKPSFLET